VDEEVAMPQLQMKSAEADQRAAVIAKAFIRAGDKLDLTNKVLANLIGLSDSSITRIRGGDARLLADGSKPRELATLFLRLYRSLDAIMGGDDAVSTQWLRNANSALGGVPIEMMQTAQGLIRVIDYLDSRRAVV
jgi:hypothetical protein